MKGLRCVLPALRAWRLCRAVAHKEWLQLRQDRLTLALLVGVPLAQILLFGFAISLAPPPSAGSFLSSLVAAL